MSPLSLRLFVSLKEMRLQDVSWERLKKGFIACAAINCFGTLAVGRFFTNNLLSSSYPQLFAIEGQIMAILWGGAFYAAVPSLTETRALPCMYGVFCLEKLFFTASWALWWYRQRSLWRDKFISLYKKNSQVAFFFLGYGVYEASAALLFATAYTKAAKHNRIVGT